MNIEQLTKLQQELNAANDRIVELEAFLRRYMYRVEMRGREPITVVERLLNKDWSDKDFEAFAKGCGITPPIRINCPCTMTPPQKDTKMIDLSIGSTVVIDDKFNDCWNDAAHLVGVPVQVMAMFDGLGLDDGESIPMVAVSNKGGSSSCFRADMCQVVDPRHWLKDLPDADLFDKDVKSIECTNLTNEGWWVCIDKMGERRWLPIKMPKLTGDEWRDSKISIPDLKAWQEQNPQ